MTQLSRDELQFIEDYDAVEPGWASQMASELLALRKEREAQEPVAWLTEGWVQNRSCE